MKCPKCGSENLWQSPSMINPIVRGEDKLIITCCQDCWEPIDFVNGVVSRIVFVPLLSKEQIIQVVNKKR